MSNLIHKIRINLNRPILLSGVFLDILNIRVQVYKASTLGIESKGNQYLIDVCNKLNADKYIFGEQGENYADKEAFRKAGVEVYFQKYSHPTYKQKGRDFLPYMSVIDLLFNEGEKSYDILMSGNIVNLENIV